MTFIKHKFLPKSYKLFFRKVLFLLHTLFTVKHCLHTYIHPNTLFTHLPWTHFIFISLFWLSKFYFKQFNHNSKLIAFDLLSKDGNERRGTILKKTPKMVGVPNFWWKTHLSSLSLKIMQFRSLEVSKNQFWYKSLFLLIFLVLNLRKNREIIGFKWLREKINI